MVQNILRIQLCVWLVGADEIDAIATKRETAQREMERRIVAQMLTCLDELGLPVSEPGTQGTGGPPEPSVLQVPTVKPHVAVIGNLPPPRGDMAPPGPLCASSVGRL